jgi:hypothetical protein
LIDVLPQLLLAWAEQPPPAGSTANVQKILGAILAARKGILRAWQAGSYPSKVELVAALVASFLPYARYPDTPTANARLCLELSSRFVQALGDSVLMAPSTASPYAMPSPRS